MIAQDFKITFEVLGSQTVNLDQVLIRMERSGHINSALDLAASHVSASGEKLEDLRVPWATGMQRVLQHLKNSEDDDYRMISCRITSVGDAEKGC